jgi:2-dehydro-3-deoxyphosphooctonate aldolase (KDO 8-P synthase)
LFVEVHEAPERALSDGANALPLDQLAGFWRRLTELDAVTRRHLRPVEELV